MMFKWSRKKCCGIVFVGFMLLLIYTFSVNFSRPNITVERGRSGVQTFKSSKHSEEFPKIIHQIFFYVTSDTVPDNWKSAQDSWKTLAGFDYMLWNQSMVTHLIANEYSSLLVWYNNYGHWVRQTDVARYVILHRYGGVYADLDVKRSTKHHLVDFINSLPNQTTSVVCRTEPFGVSNDFMMAKPGDLFLEYVISGLPAAQRSYVFPYLTTMLSTGPVYLSLRYHTFPLKDIVTVLSSDDLPGKYINHISGASWHQWDGQLFWWLYINTPRVIGPVKNAGMIIAALIVVIVICFKARNRFVNTSRCRRIQ